MTMIATTAPAPDAGLSLSGREKAAVIVRLLLSEGAEPPLQALPDHMQAALTEQIGRMRSVDRPTLRAVVEDFCASIESVGLSFPGGIEGALGMLGDHISADAASRLRRLANASDAADPWVRLAGQPPERLMPVLEREAVEVGAVLLSKLPVARAAELLGLLPGERARRLAFAVSQTGSVAPETVRRIGQALAQDLEAQPSRAFDASPGERMGAILNLSASATRDEVLRALDEEDRDFATAVRKSIFTFADVPARLDPRDVPKAVRGVDQAVLVRALAGASGDQEAAAEFILSALSQRMAATLREEMADLGKVREKDAEAAQTELVGAVRDLVAAGEIRLKTEAEDD
ncbi:flagellar motor switch protein FliG [Albidovulum sediminicola]|uniref:Flagellar motor switch protein FliG n=1 Tax=Albidovulum sediminicola TaxID=2984331 RepID=A0ABT2Z2L1_9RHOB|nr:FliG C-terminal domain-containing protein [Defluviimonas sp. WL0075]MCV2865352.1 flagellar motor switch protein FliG [Defluviimonas sp. WL0075]